MDIGDNGEFRRRLVTLGELFDLKLGASRQALYFEALRDLPFDAVALALNQAAKACTFFPKPAELRKLAVGDQEDLAERAWMAFRQTMRLAGAYASIVVDDAALGEAITAVFQSWPQACSVELSPEMWASKRKEFGRVYRVLRDRNLNGSRYLCGISEQQNAGKRDWMAYVQVSRLEQGGCLSRLSLAEAEIARTQIATVSHEFSRMDGEMPARLASETA